MRILKLIFGGLLLVSAMFWLVNRYSLHLDQQIKRSQNPRKRASLGSIQLPAARRGEFSAAAEIVPEEPGDSALEIANEYLSQMKVEFGIMPYHDLSPQVSKNPLGTRIRYSISQNGVPIHGYNLWLTVDAKTGSIDESANDLKYEPVDEIDLDLEEYLDRDELIETLNTDTFHPAQNQKIRKVLFVPPQSPAPVMAFVVQGRDPRRNSNIQIMVRASDGQILRKYYSRKEF